MHEGIRSSTGGTAGPAIPERRVLNLRCFSDEQRTQVLEAFEHLSTGDSFEIARKGPVGQLVAELQARYGTGFYWWPLERGPLAWRAILAKPALDAPASVTTVMGVDHLRLCGLWTQFKHAVERCEIDRIHRRSAELSLGLRRYIDIEEAILFPVLEAQTKMRIAGRTERMRAEHREIAPIVDQLENLCMTNECAAALKIFDRPVEAMTLFEHHCRREEAGLYPFMDMVFNPIQERQLLSLLQTFEI